jgi:hypothetical protein
VAQLFSLGIIMRPGKTLRILLMVAASLLILGVCGVVALRLMFSRTREFRAQAQIGQPIVRAIEDFRKQTGSFPPSLTDLAPKYLATLPDIQQEEHYKRGSWEYRVVTNGEAVSYSLRSYMGSGGVEYQPPNWIGNDEGHRTVVLSNE